MAAALSQAVAMTAGADKWRHLEEAYAELQKDIQWKVQLPPLRRAAQGNSVEGGHGAGRPRLDMGRY